MNEKFKPKAFLKSVADDVTCLRACDVYRLLDTCPVEHRRTLASYVIGRRRDLENNVAACLAELGTD